MKRLMLLGVAIALCGAAVANADLFGTFTSAQGDAVGVNFTRNAQTGDLAGVDEIVLTLASVAPTGSKVYGAGALAPVNDARFHALDGSYFFIAADFTDWKGAVKPASFANFNADVTGLYGTEVVGTWKPAANAADLVTYSTFQDTWQTSASAQWIGLNGILAKLYLPTGGNFEYDGNWFINGNLAEGHGTTAVIPEPGTLVLLATGLMGLIAYAWRKRK